ncbi:MAG: 5'-methylthioadenosine/S-adenosylhomocysteine nucleosidase [Sulfurovum sp.]|nr:5'-methylthioadenosine/S-adenosylhomocysteine nucleosidase [Sulfurovum sp.]
MVICAGKIEQIDGATPIGIGMVESAINLTRYCIDKKPEYILFVGTAGSYGGLELMSTVESVRACNIEQSSLRGDAYTPTDNTVSSCNYDKGNVSHETIVNSSNYICTSSEIAKKYLEINIAIENMEFYAILKVAERFGIPAKGIFIVTNYCNVSAHKDFIKNRQEAIRLLTDKVFTVDL